jgi:hypothetical protein
MQVKASFKKEILAFTRTKKFLILICVFVGLSLFSAVLMRGMSAMIELVGEDEMFAAGVADAINASAINGVVAAISDMSQVGLLVFLLLLNSFSGGEQKRRSVIIPTTQGLRSFSYIFPKFIIYPVVVFVFAIIGVLAASVISSRIFDNNDLIMSRVLLSGTLLGVYLMMFVCFHLSLGTATGRAGMSAAVCIVASFILPSVFQTLASTGVPGGVNAEMYAYNPFALSLLAGQVLTGGHEVSAQDITMTAVVAVVLMVIVYFVALFVQNAKRIDNSGNEKLI